MPAIHEITAITCSALIHSYIRLPHPVRRWNFSQRSLRQSRS
jgi:hypothetical protein